MTFYLSEPVSEPDFGWQYFPQGFDTGQRPFPQDSDRLVIAG